MLLIKNGKILTMADIDYEKGCVLIDKGKIKQVAKHIDEKASYKVMTHQATGFCQV